MQNDVQIVRFVIEVPIAEVNQNQLWEIGESVAQAATDLLPRPASLVDVLRQDTFWRSIPRKQDG